MRLDELCSRMIADIDGRSICLPNLFWAYFITFAQNSTVTVPPKVRLDIGK